MTVLEEVKAALRMVIKRRTISDDDNLISDLGMDSLDIAELVGTLDDKYELGDHWENFFAPRTYRALLQGSHLDITPAAMAAFIDGECAGR